jgi:RimJ/RimL family protein N-acetyltransferase
LLVLREVIPSDLGDFFEFMQDEESLWQAAFTPKEPGNRTSHDEHWQKILNNPSILNRTILVNEKVVGHIGRYFMDDVAQITYWLGSQFKGKGFTTEALALFLELDQTRPMEARTAFDNAASARVLSKNGFVEVGTDSYFANARGEEIQEVIWRLV